MKSVSFQDKIALYITSVVGSMYCAYAFAFLACISLPNAIENGISTLISWIAQTFLQLVLLSIIMVGQRIQNQNAEQQSKEAQIKHDKILLQIEKLETNILNILKNHHD